MQDRHTQIRRSWTSTLLFVLLALMLLVGLSLQNRDMLLHQALQLLLRDYGVTLLDVQGFHIGTRSAQIDALQAVLPGATTPTRIENLRVDYALAALRDGRIQRIAIDSVDLHPPGGTQTTMLPNAETVAATLTVLQAMPAFSADIGTLRIAPWSQAGSFSARTDQREFRAQWRAGDVQLDWQSNWHDQAFVSSHFIPDDSITERRNTPAANTTSVQLQQGGKQILRAELSTYQSDDGLLVDGSIHASLAALSTALQAGGVAGELAAGIAGEARLHAQVTLPAARNAPVQVAAALQPLQGTWTRPASRLHWHIEALTLAGECQIQGECRFAQTLAGGLQTEAGQPLREAWPSLQLPGNAMPAALELDASGSIAWAAGQWQYDSPRMVIDLPQVQLNDQSLGAQLTLSALQAAGRTSPPGLQRLETTLRLDNVQGIPLPHGLPFPALSASLSWDGVNLKSNGTLQIAVAPVVFGELEFSTTTGLGRVHMRLPAMQFDAGDARLSRLLQTSALPGDILAGRLSAQADLDLTRNATGSLQASGPLALQLDGISGFAGETAVTGLSTQLRARLDGSALRSDGLTPLTIESLDPGIPLQNLQAEIAIDTEAGVLRLAALSLEAFGGRVASQGGEFSLAGPAGMLELQLQQIDVERILALGAYEGVQASGLLSGSLPLRLDTNGITISAGSVHAELPGGSIRYTGTANSGNAAVDFVNTTLNNYRYDLLDASVDYRPDGELALAVQMQGVNPDNNPAQRINLNLNISDNIPSLLRSLQAGRSITDAVEAHLRAR